MEQEAGNGGGGFFTLKPGKSLFGAKKRSSAGKTRSVARKISEWPEKTLFDAAKTIFFGLPHSKTGSNIV